uniref:Uncharacterized protein n=1 Tax=Rhizophora mucronata TaxID=61149 RepID=A0A2P2QW45_RHIMU
MYDPGQWLTCAQRGTSTYSVERMNDFESFYVVV